MALGAVYADEQFITAVKLIWKHGIHGHGIIKYGEIICQPLHSASLTARLSI